MAKRKRTLNPLQGELLALARKLRDLLANLQGIEVLAEDDAQLGAVMLSEQCVGVQNLLEELEAVIKRTEKAHE